MFDPSRKITDIFKPFVTPLPVPPRITLAGAPGAPAVCDMRIRNATATIWRDHQGTHYHVPVWAYEGSYHRPEPRRDDDADAVEAPVLGDVAHDRHFVPAVCPHKGG